MSLIYDIETDVTCIEGLEIGMEKGKLEGKLEGKHDVILQMLKKQK